MLARATQHYVLSQDAVNNVKKHHCAKNYHNMLLVFYVGPLNVFIPLLLFKIFGTFEIYLDVPKLLFSGFSYVMYLLWPLVN
jgi:hypothetical protein